MIELKRDPRCAGVGRHAGFPARFRHKSRTAEIDLRRALAVVIVDGPDRPGGDVDSKNGFRTVWIGGYTRLNRIRGLGTQHDTEQQSKYGRFHFVIAPMPINLAIARPLGGVGGRARSSTASAQIPMPALPTNAVGRRILRNGLPAVTADGRLTAYGRPDLRRAGSGQTACPSPCQQENPTLHSFIEKDQGCSLWDQKQNRQSDKE